MVQGAALGSVAQLARRLFQMGNSGAEIEQEQPVQYINAEPGSPEDNVRDLYAYYRKQAQIDSNTLSAEENVVASAQNDGTIGTDQLSYEERSALVDSILQTDSAQLWGQLPDGTNQGIKHFINYKNKYPQRILSLEQRLGVQTGDFSNTVQGFKLFTQRALEVIKHGKVREINGKKFYYLDGVANSKKGVIVIVKDGKIQSVMPSDFKSFNRLK